MLGTSRKKKKKHLKLNIAGSKTTAHIGSKVIRITVTIPRALLLKRLSD